MTTVKVDKAIILPQYWSVDYGQDGPSDHTTTVLLCDDYGQGGQGDHTAILLVSDDYGQDGQSDHTATVLVY